MIIHTNYISCILVVLFFSFFHLLFFFCVFYSLFFVFYFYFYVFLFFFFVLISAEIPFKKIRLFSTITFQKVFYFV